MVVARLLLLLLQIVCNHTSIDTRTLDRSTCAIDGRFQAADDVVLAHDWNIPFERPLHTPMRRDAFICVT